MAKKKITAELYSYGIYSRWDKDSKKLPQLINITDTIRIEPGIEFGCVVKIKGGKGKLLEFRIDHPPFIDSKGNIAQPFTGKCFVNSNEYDFFLGDTVWKPYNDKAGEWELNIFIDGKRISYKKLTLYK